MYDTDLSLYEKDMIMQIVKRAHNWYCAHMPLGAEPRKWELEAEITMVHEAHPLRLREMLMADDFNFMHDMVGIRVHLDRTTGKLRDCFVPRFTA
jgi:hypothetical protein